MNTHNFSFLTSHYEQLSELATLAEKLLHIDAGSCLTRLRSFAEEMVKEIYKEEKFARLPQATFNELLKSTEFRNSVDKSLWYQLDYLRIEGNRTAHGAVGKIEVAKQALKTAHKLAIYMAVRYANLPIDELPAYIEPTFEASNTATTKRLQALEEEQKHLHAVIAQLEAERLEQARSAEMLSTDDLALRQQQSQQVANSLNWDEATTRRQLIDAMLANADWNLHNRDDVQFEYRLTNFTGSISGKGAVDYVLWDSDGKPLAVLEAKKTSVEVQRGREQARLYADALEAQFGQRPIIFYSNGYETYIWDDTVYNSPRQIFSFYDKESLQKLLFQRQYKLNLAENYPTECTQIAGRNYQTQPLKPLQNISKTNVVRH